MDACHDFGYWYVKIDKKNGRMPRFWIVVYKNGQKMDGCHNYSLINFVILCAGYIWGQINKNKNRWMPLLDMLLIA
jgi:hypothetical protein